MVRTRTAFLQTNACFHSYSRQSRSCAHSRACHETARDKRRRGETPNFMCSRLCEWVMGNCLPRYRGDDEDEGDTLGANMQPTAQTTPTHTLTRSMATTSSRSAQPTHQHRKSEDMTTTARTRRAALLQHLPTGVYTEGGKGDSECIICMEELEEGDPIRYLPCLHSYHQHCIDDWLSRKFQCPSCMEPVEAGLFSSFSVANETTLGDMMAASSNTSK